jgi:hypothetical protein
MEAVRSNKELEELIIHMNKERQDSLSSLVSMFKRFITYFAQTVKAIVN